MIVLIVFTYISTHIQTDFEPQQMAEKQEAQYWAIWDAHLVKVEFLLWVSLARGDK